MLVISKLTTAFRFPISPHFPSSGTTFWLAVYSEGRHIIVFPMPLPRNSIIFPDWVGGQWHPQGSRGPRGRKVQGQGNFSFPQHSCELCWHLRPGCLLLLLLPCSGRTPHRQPFHGSGWWFPLSSGGWAEHGSLCWLRFLQSCRELPQNYLSIM